jgi:hypothetical protein
MVAVCLRRSNAACQKYYQAVTSVGVIRASGMYSPEFPISDCLYLKWASSCTEHDPHRSPDRATSTSGLVGEVTGTMVHPTDYLVAGAKFARTANHSVEGLQCSEKCDAFIVHSQ